MFYLTLIIGFFFNTFCMCSYETSTVQVSDDIKQLIFANARKRIEPEFAACGDFKCIEDYLYKEEKKKIDIFLGECDIKAEDRDRVYDRVSRDAKVRSLQAWYGQQIQDEKNVGVELVAKTKKFIKKSGGNPDAIDIVTDREYFAKNPDRIATTTNKTFYAPAKIRYNTEEIISNHTVAHEVTHFIELHPDIKAEMLNYLQNNIYLKPMSIPQFHQAYRDWRHAQEIQADLFPLIRYKNKKLIEQLIEKNLPECVEDHFHGDFILRLPSRVHPTCMELLPKILKIKDLSDAGAKPLHEKPGNNSKSL